MRLLRLTKRVLEYLVHSLAFRFAASEQCDTYSFPIIATLLLALAWVKPRNEKIAHVNM